MGAAVGFACAVQAPERFRSLICGGGNPEPGNPAGPDRLREWPQQGIQAYTVGVAGLFGPRMTPTLHARLLANDVEALIAERLAARRG